jgi:quercetin dioxygenase-like cupin family protein
MVQPRRIVSPGEGVTLPFMPRELLIWKATGETTGGALDCCELRLDPQVGPPEHIHHQHDETFLVLDGSVRFKVGEERVDASVGTFVFVPRGTPHAWKNIGSEQARLLIVFTPGGMRGYFEELQPLLPALMAGITDMTKVDATVMAQADAVMQRYQYELVGPPVA